MGSLTLRAGTARVKKASSCRLPFVHHGSTEDTEAARTGSSAIGNEICSQKHTINELRWCAVEYKHLNCLTKQISSP
jgi:hypothetical protein